MGSVFIPNQPHAVCIPFPAQGHLNPMLKLAKILHSKGFHITFVNTDFNHKRLLKSIGPEFLKASPSFQFHSIPDGLPSSDVEATQDIPALAVSTSKNCIGPFRDLLTKLNNSTSLDVPPVTCIISDGVMSFTMQAAEELGIPAVLFWTPSFIGFTSYLQFPALIDKGYVPLKDESYFTDGYLETPIDWIPGMKNIRLKDLPSFMRTTDLNDVMIKSVLENVAASYKASALIFNTFDALEHEVLNAIKSEVQLPPVYTIGPLSSLLLPENLEGELKSIGGNLWKEERECLKWLETKESNSVLYINFGSITIITPQQMIEFAWGLAKSNQTFLWIIRQDLGRGESAILPPEFLTETAERSMIASWCPQEEVLDHPSVGGFLTYGGWNSTLESICSGVPMISWPFFAEQQMNCRYSCVHWGISMEINTDVKRDEVESLVRELMEGQKGEEMKSKVMELKKKAQKAAAPGGSSHLNIDVLVNQLLLSSGVFP